MSNVTWRKSSYSNATGGECVEMSVDLLSAAAWRKSSYSNSDGGACLEVAVDLLSAAAWRKSSYSNQDGGACLEVADDLAVVPVRDSKDSARGPLVFGVSAWREFVGGLRGAGQ
nr:DUF397 domain-containing protein [Streptomyces sp. SID4950]